MKPGPVPNPNLRSITGGGLKRPALTDRLEAQVELPEPPAWMQDEARAEWERVGAVLVQLCNVSLLDRALLTMYCVNWQRFCLAEMKVAELNLADPFRKKGHVHATPNGYEQISAWVVLSKQAQDAMKVAIEGFGLSPAQRTRIIPSNAGQLGLPGIPESGDALGSFIKRGAA